MLDKGHSQGTHAHSVASYWTSYFGLGCFPPTICYLFYIHLLFEQALTVEQKHSFVLFKHRPSFRLS